MNNYLLGISYSGFFLSIFLLIEYFTRKKNFNIEHTRKIIHILSGLFGAVMGVIFERDVFVFLIGMFLIIISVSYFFKFFTSIHNVRRKTFGEILFPIGILAAYIISDGSTEIYLASVLILSISDPLSGFFGNISKKKTYLGPLLFFISALLILLIIFKFDAPIKIIIISLILTLIEKISSRGTDNLTVPVIASLLLIF